MPSPYRRETSRLKAEIVARLEAGETQRAVCASPGMPHPYTVRNWAAADPAFADALALARARGNWRRRFRFDEDVAAAFLARARAGETINSLIGAAGMPSRSAYRHWCRTQGAFAEAVFALRRRRDAGLGERGRARRRGFDPAVADRVIVALNKGIAAGMTLEAVLAADPALPCRPVLRRWRRENPEFDRVLKMFLAAGRARRGRLAPVDALSAWDVAQHIKDGGSFASYSREPGGPSRVTLRRWFRKDAAFAAAVREACEAREAREALLVFEMQLAAERVPDGPIREMNRAIAPFTRAIARLRHRPGTPHRPPRGRDSGAEGP